LGEPKVEPLLKEQRGIQLGSTHRHGLRHPEQPYCASGLEEAMAFPQKVESSRTMASSSLHGHSLVASRV
jgi:hypothetical protein